MKKRLSVLLSVILILGLVFASFPFKVAMAAMTVKITLLETSDVHGAIYPYDYFKDAPANGGFAKLSTLVKVSGLTIRIPFSWITATISRVHR